ncbi:MAG: hypothetical protein EAZ61_09390 [Oscillatoriales cyanobacterium]|nr:MAG: hypothetical protein EAZ61_09390 [Oscillatoriales cyanobacterium]
MGFVECCAYSNDPSASTGNDDAIIYLPFKRLMSRMRMGGQRFQGKRILIFDAPKARFRALSGVVGVAFAKRIVRPLFADTPRLRPDPPAID